MSYVRKLWLRRKFEKLLDRILAARAAGEDPIELQTEAYVLLVEINGLNRAGRISA